MKRHSTHSKKTDSGVPKKRKRSRRNSPGLTAHRGYQRILESPRSEEITTRLRSGISVEDVSKWLREDCQEFLDVSAAALNRQLYRYRDTIPGAARPNKAHIVEELAKERSKGFNALRVEIELAVVQQHRLGQVLELEEKGNHLLPDVGNEIDRLSRLVQNVAASKLRLGILKLEADSYNEPGAEKRFDLIATVLEKKYGDDVRPTLIEFGRSLHQRLQEIRWSNEQRQRLRSGSEESRDSD